MLTLLRMLSEEIKLLLLSTLYLGYICYFLLVIIHRKAIFQISQECKHIPETKVI